MQIVQQLLSKTSGNDSELLFCFFNLGDLLQPIATERRCNYIKQCSLPSPSKKTLHE